MRIRDTIKLSGYFWLPKNPDKKLPGTLQITNGGRVELDVLGLFDETIEGINKFLNNIDHINRVIGHVEKHGLITLDGCSYKNKNYDFIVGISKSTIRSNQAIFGVAYDEKERILLNSFKFSIEGINEWVGISGINVTNNFDTKSSIVSYVPPKDISFQLKNGMTLSITYGWSIPFFSNISEAKISQQTFFELKSEKGREQKDFISAAYIITTLLCFVIDKTVCIDSATGTNCSLINKVSEEKSRYIQLTFYYSSLPYVEKASKIDVHQMLFQFVQVQNDAERIINNWFKAYDIIEPALNLYFSSKDGAHKFIESKFLTLAQCIETYHRRTSKENLMDETKFNDLVSCLIEFCPKDHKGWLEDRLRHGNELSLSKRIKKIIEPFKEYFGSSKERNKLIRIIVDSRNYLTHYDKSLEHKAPEGAALYKLCQRIQAIFQFHLLYILGFSKEEISSIHKNSQGLRNKIS